MTIRLGPGAEFDRIRAFLEGAPAGRGVRVGPGDDAAVLDEGLVLSTDLSIEGVHFRLDWITAEEAGGRATCAALSDLAAMAAAAAGILVSIAVPSPGRVADEVMKGIRAAAERQGAVILGGDLARSPGPVIIDIVVVGRADRPLLRSGARPGNELWVTGTLGAAATAVEAWRRGVEPSPVARAAFVRPIPRLAEARWLVEALDARAGIDLSDGIAGDARHIAAASGVAIELEADLLLGIAYADGDGERSDLLLDRALHGGEDYELLVALPAGVDVARVEEFRNLFDLPLTRVGRVVDGDGVRLIPSGGGPPRDPGGGGWDHFDPDLDRTTIS